MWRMIKNTTRYVTGFRPGMYVGLYLVSIPVFGLIYSLLPFHFYHSTTKHEPLFAEQKSMLEKSITKYMQSNYDKKVKPQLVLRYGAIPPSIEVFIDSVEYIENRDAISFKAGIMPLYTPVPEGKLVDTVLSCDVTMLKYNDLRIGPHFFITQFTYPTEVTNIRAFSKSYPWIDETILFGEKLEDSYYLSEVPFDLRKELGEFVSTARGFPVDKFGNLLIRMTYFSTVTITTMGYGDIVPVSSLSRILVGFEGIWGIVMIGLFINSLSERWGGSSKDPRDIKNKRNKKQSPNQAL